MKRILAVILTITLLVSLAACANQPTNEPTTPTTTPTTTAPTITLQDALDQMPEATHYDWADDLPIMDGSTSTIPLEAGIRAALFGTSIAEAELQVKHSTTYGSFYNLLDNKCDLIFSVPLSEKQLAEAAQRGMELEMAKVAAEGFVFVLNANNPVDTLTQQQLKDIYSGKITNWSEVGGNDAPIIAYQRNETSGSQNFMHTFMGDTPLMDPLMSATFTPAGMGSLMDAVAYYDNAENAIGYSVYAYAADMYGNGDEIKFVHVDGVEPTKATMADGSYPLLSFNYAVFKKTFPADSSLRKLVAWLDTDEGQRAVKAAGYIPLRNVGEVPETVVQLYSAVGTGPEKPADHTPSLDQYCVESYGGLVQGDNTIDGLVNAELEDEINAFIAENEGLNTTIECINGYLAVSIGGKTAIYDLVAGKRIAFSDLFFKGVEFVPTLNAVLREETKRQTTDLDEDNELIVVDAYSLKREFIGIPAGHDAFMLSNVVFPQDNLYFDTAVFLPFKGLYSQTVLSVSRDMSDLFEDSVKVRHVFADEYGFGVQKPLLMNNMSVTLLSDAHYDAAVCQTVNDAIRTHCETNLSEEALLAWEKQLGDRGSAAYTYGSLDVAVMGDRYFRIAGTLNMNELSPYGTYLIFDAKTGEQVPYTAFLKEGWQEHARWVESKMEEENGDQYYIGYYSESQPEIACPDLSKAVLMGFDAGAYYMDGKGAVLTFGLPDSDTPLVCAAVPDEYINWQA